MRNMLKLYRYIGIFFVAVLFSNTVYANNIKLEGETSIVKTNAAYNTNPWNTDKILGGGENGTLNLYVTSGKIDIAISQPLYYLNDFYKDIVVEKDGVWGIERRVGVKVFDGSEDWEIYNNIIYKNNKTVIFKGSFGHDIAIRNGISTHFDVNLPKTQKTTVYDGIAFGENNDEILMRFMNVRNVNTVEGLKTYLQTQKENGNPVKLFYALTESIFEPFDDESQAKLHNNNLLGYSGKNLKISSGETTTDTSIFINSDFENDTLKLFLSAITEVEIYENNEELFVSGIYPTNKGISLEFKNNLQETFTGLIEYKTTDFLSNKPTEVICYGENDKFIRVLIELNKIQVPTVAIDNLDYKTTGIRNDYVKSTQLVIPNEIVASKGTTLDFKNAILYGGNTKNISIYDANNNLISNTGVLKVEDSMDIKIVLDDSIVAETSITADTKHMEKNLDVMFLGDSIINQDYYTQFFKEKNQSLNLVGTRGSNGNKHEGRGGWSAFDYCNEKSKYGFTNPFLNNNTFDFSYYMTSNNVEKLDYVVINLGINDTNLVGHNDINEILSNFDTIINSIHKYDENIKILVNTPINPFDEFKNQDAKNRRLNLTNAMYDNLEQSNVYISPAHLYINGFDDFKFTEPVLNSTNQLDSLVVTDATHPNVWGYKFLANGTYDVISFLESK